MCHVSSVLCIECVMYQVCHVSSHPRIFALRAPIFAETHYLFMKCAAEVFTIEVRPAMLVFV